MDIVIAKGLLIVALILKRRNLSYFYPFLHCIIHTSWLRDVLIEKFIKMLRKAPRDALT